MEVQMIKANVLKVTVFFFILVAIVFFTRQLSVRAQEKSSDDSTATKLDQLLSGQQQILQEINALKSQVSSIQNSTNKL
jgi:large-conductance mechanosensitive channel